MAKLSCKVAGMPYQYNKFLFKHIFRCADSEVAVVSLHFMGIMLANHYTKPRGGKAWDRNMFSPSLLLF